MYVFVCLHFRFTQLGAIGVEWCAGSSPFGRAALREGRSCVCFERDDTIIQIVAAALVDTQQAVLASLPTPEMLKRKRSVSESEIFSSLTGYAGYDETSSPDTASLALPSLSQFD